jgi:Ca-activated chloride channel family protein
METSDFDNDEKDAGDMGAGQTVTIVYEVAGTNDSITKDSAPIKLNIRYKKPSAKKSTEVSHNIATTVKDSISSDMEFIALAIETVMVLNHSQYLGNNSRGLSEIAHDMQYVNLNKSQKDFYKTLVTLVNNSTTPVVDEPIDPIVYTSPQKDTTQIYN